MLLLKNISVSSPQTRSHDRLSLLPQTAFCCHDVHHFHRIEFPLSRYLQESGFLYSVFALGYVAGTNWCPDGDFVPPGALVIVLQKGPQYLETGS